MAMAKETAAPKTQLPEWELPPDNGAAAATGKPALTTRVAAKLDALLPAHRTYFGRSRRVILLLGAGALLAVIGLVVGLAVGLTVGRGGGHAQNLPLPTSATAHTGDLTYYAPGLGACGITSSNTDHIVSISQLVFDAAGANAGAGGDPNSNPLCGRKIRARRFNEAVSEDRSLDLTVVDRCVGCKASDIDVSPGAFDELAPRESGRVVVSWAWLGEGE